MSIVTRTDRAGRERSRRGRHRVRLSRPGSWGGGPPARCCREQPYLAGRPTRRNVQLRPRRAAGVHVGRRQGRWKASPWERSSNCSVASCSTWARHRAWLAGDRLHVQTTATLDQALVCTGVQSDDPRAVAAFGQRITELAGRCRGVRCIGSPALCLAFVSRRRSCQCLPGGRLHLRVGCRRRLPVDHGGGR